MSQEHAQVQQRAATPPKETASPAREQFTRQVAGAPASQQVQMLKPSRPLQFNGGGSTPPPSHGGASAGAGGAIDYVKEAGKVTGWSTLIAKLGDARFADLNKPDFILLCAKFVVHRNLSNDDPVKQQAITEMIAWAQANSDGLKVRPDGTVLYTGQREAAEGAAAASGGQTVEKGTVLGGFWDGLQFEGSWQWSQLGNLWQQLSSTFAGGSKGKVNVHTNVGVNTGSIFYTKEYPALVALGDKIEEIRFHVYHKNKDSSGKEIWQKHREVTDINTLPKFGRGDPYPNDGWPPGVTPGTKW